MKRHAYIDVKGTLVHHQQLRPVPLMDDLLQAMSDQGWLITILSSYPSTQCAQLLDMAGISLPQGTRVLSSSGCDKGEVLFADLNKFDADEIIFLDDKPRNLHAVKTACRDHVRVIGFVGSRKYVPGLSQWCANSQIELALSSVDLCEGLGVSLNQLRPSDFEKLSESDLISLMPGLDHPRSATAGETAQFDHRRIFSTLFEYKKLKNFEEFWSNLGWITCNECLWKTLVESVLLAKSLRREDVLGSAYKDYEYTTELESYARKNPAVDLKSTFENAMHWMQTGIRNLGIGAEVCRIANRPMEADRLQTIEQRIQECFV
jgi:hypothetical protein